MVAALPEVLASRNLNINSILIISADEDGSR